MRGYGWAPAAAAGSSSSRAAPLPWNGAVIAESRPYRRDAFARSRNGLVVRRQATRPSSHDATLVVEKYCGLLAGADRSIAVTGWNTCVGARSRATAWRGERLGCSHAMRLVLYAYTACTPGCPGRPACSCQEKGLAFELKRLEQTWQRPRRLPAPAGGRGAGSWSSDGAVIAEAPVDLGEPRGGLPRDRLWLCRRRSPAVSSDAIRLVRWLTATSRFHAGSAREPGVARRLFVPDPEARLMRSGQRTSQASPCKAMPTSATIWNTSAWPVLDRRTWPIAGDGFSLSRHRRRGAALRRRLPGRRASLGKRSRAVLKDWFDARVTRSPSNARHRRAETIPGFPPPATTRIWTSRARAGKRLSWPATVVYDARFARSGSTERAVMDRDWVWLLPPVRRSSTHDTPGPEGPPAAQRNPKTIIGPSERWRAGTGDPAPGS